MKRKPNSIYCRGQEGLYYDHSPDILLIISSGNCNMIITCLHAGRKFKELIGNRNETHYETG